MKTILRSVLVMMVIVVAGCVSTPADRIKKEPRVFASFPPEIQAKVKQGVVEVGFTPDMVRLALGLPRRINTRITEAGQSEIWIYTSVRTVAYYEPMNTGYWYRDRAGRMCRSYDAMWIDRGYTEEFPTLRLEFADNKVKAIERLKR